MISRLSPRALIIATGVALFSAAPAFGQFADALLATPDDLACAPRLAANAPSTTGYVVGSPHADGRQLFGPRDSILLAVGAAHGVSVGTRFFTQRVATAAASTMRERGLRPLVISGWIRVVALETYTSHAVVETACRVIRRGDQLSAFTRPAAVSPESETAARYDNPATVIFGADGRALSGTGSLVVIDHGAEQQLVIGQRVTVFRFAPHHNDHQITKLGDGVVMLVHPTSAVVQLLSSIDSVRSGDLAAIHPRPKTGR
jgi:hypothetical protein